MLPLQLGQSLIIKGYSKLIQSEVGAYNLNKSNVRYIEKKDKLSLLLSDIDVDDTNWYAAKEFLRTSYRGREVLNWAENNLETNSNYLKNFLILIFLIAYVVLQMDVGKMAKAYVDDIVAFIDVANRENKRILSKADLLN